MPASPPGATVQEIFEYRFTKLDPVTGDHIDPPTVAIYETLLRKGPGGQPLPGLATAWWVSGDELTWRLSLREGASYHSGERCDAPAVVAALDRCRWGDSGGRQLWYWDPVDAVGVADAATVEIRLHYPYPRLPTLLWGTHTSIHNDRLRTELGPDYGVTAADGTGPYELASFGPGEVRARLATAPGTARMTSVRAPAELRWLSLPAESQRGEALTGSSADIVRALPSDWLDRSEPGPWQITELPEPSQFYLGLNFSSRFDFGRLEMRRALEALINRDDLVAAALAGHGDARRSPVPAADHYAAAFDPAGTARMNAAEAERMLDDLGWLRDDSGERAKEGLALRFACVTQDTEPFRRIAEVLAGQLGKAGVSIEFRFVEPFEAFYRACEAQPEAFVSKWLWQDAIEAIMGFSQSSCADGGGCNWQGARLPAVDSAYEAYLHARTEAELQQASARVQELFMRDLPYLPLCSPADTIAAGPRVEGFRAVAGTLYPDYRDLGLRDG
jgi:peptide/nickel transport system substrate-binding protein